MPTDHIIQLLVAERDRINAAIAALGGGTVPKKRGRPAKNPLADAPDWVQPKTKPARKKRTFSAKQRAEQATRMKKYWAAKKKAAKSS